MPEINLSDFEEKFSTLLKRLQLLYSEKQKLKQQVAEQELEIARQKERLEEMEEKVKVMKITSSPENGEGEEFRKEIRTTINSYIREIDNCIALLNK